MAERARRDPKGFQNDPLDFEHDQEWTTEERIHELMTISNGDIDMESISKEGEEVVRDMSELVGQSQSLKIVYQTSDRITIQRSKLDQFPALALILAGEHDANEALYEAVKNGRIEHIIMILACSAKLESKDGFITI